LSGDRTIIPRNAGNVGPSWIRLWPGNDHERQIVGAVAWGKPEVRLPADFAESVDLGLRENLSREAH